MSYFDKKRIIFWVVAAVIIVNFAAIGTIIYKVYQIPKHRKCNTEKPCAQSYLEKELNLSPAQAEEFRKLKQAQHDSVSVLQNKMKEKRAIISENMTGPLPDTTLLFKTSDDLGDLYAATRKLYIRHYFDLCNECTTEQRAKLAQIYTKVFCHGDGCNMAVHNRCREGSNIEDGCGHRPF